MKITQSTLQRTFTVKYKDKYYYVDYLNSDGEVLRLLNRDYWEVTDEDGEEVGIYLIGRKTKKRVEQAKRSWELVDKLIKFCIKHFKDYNPLEN